MDLVWIVAAAVIFLIVSVIGYLAGSGAFIVYWIILKTVIGYGWRFLAPIWILLKSRSPYKVAAIALTFSSFLLHLYSFLQAGDVTILTAATNALSATITGSLQEIVASGKTLIGSSPIQGKLFAFALFFMAAGKVYLYFVGWKMMKRRVPELTYYLLVVFSFYLLTWGSQDANALFEVFDFAQTAAGEASNQFANGSVPASGSNLTGVE